MSFVFEAIGTRWQIDLPTDLSSTVQEHAMRRVYDRIESFDQTYSRFRPDSLVTRMSQHAGVYQLPDESRRLFDLYRQLYDLSDGTFTPLIARTLEDAGYDAQYSLKSQSVLRPPLLWDETMSFQFPVLEMKQPAMLDFGAAGKGYLVDLVADILVQEGIESFCVDAGGDMIYRSAQGEAMSVGLSDPTQEGSVIGVARLGNKSLCGSAGNRRTWGEYHHIIDPRTLRSPQHIAAVWTIAATTMVADALATCLFLVPSEVLSAQFDFEYVLLFPDRSVQASSGFPAEFFRE